MVGRGGVSDAHPDAAPGRTARGAPGFGVGIGVAPVYAYEPYYGGYWGGPYVGSAYAYEPSVAYSTYAYEPSVENDTYAYGPAYSYGAYAPRAQVYAYERSDGYRYAPVCSNAPPCATALRSELTKKGMSAQGKLSLKHPAILREDLRRICDRQSAPTLVAFAHGRMAINSANATSERDLRPADSSKALPQKGFGGMEYADVMYRWQIANDLIRAHDHVRLLASVDRVTLLDMTRCSDLDKEWDRLNGRSAPVSIDHSARFDVVDA